MDKDSKQADDGVKRADYATQKGEVILRKHEYDGIQEYDQKLPNWWLVALWASIAAFLIYYTVYYTFNMVPSFADSMDAKVEAVQETRKKALAETLANLDDSTLVNEWSTDAKIVAAGSEIYASQCVACHGADYKANGGITGRALDDGIWEHGSKPMDVFKIINDGTPEGSPGLNNMKMEAWGKTKLSAKQVAEVTAFLISINPKDFAEYKK
ncbi:MAG: cbb3-type cytochrome c oxidase N-terminal domain-containing protein [Rubritalea sp.]|uniref:cbb3-type cytochrome c oxidase N-terminal domain-containing protein n=1 Tax=Rubritalea sp. TaxID=2109375 RepID=UPI003241DD9A